MCGITGWIDWQQSLLEQALVLEKMTTALALRGPDASGIWLSPTCGFGHRRLSVMDPQNGAQPMLKQTDDTTYVLTYNGEIYNAPELRRELSSLGHTFHSHCDTEVVLYACIEWGRAALHRLNGIFAFAFWDERQQTVLLARDRLGVKPLFFSTLQTGIAFASELKGLLQHPAIKAEVRMSDMAEIWGIGPARTPGHGIFRDIQELRPGHWLQYSQAGLKTGAYWQLSAQAHRDDISTTIAKVRDLVQQAARRQLSADVPLCCLLSGGLDSSALTALAVEPTIGQANRLLTFSVDYEEQHRFFESHEFQPNSDAPFITEISTYLGTEHRNIELSIAQLLATLDDVVCARDLPGMADIDASLLLFCRAIKSFATVALSGEAADEIFGGYPWFQRVGEGGARRFPWSTSTDFRSHILAPDISQSLRLEDYIRQRYEEAVAEVPSFDDCATPEGESERALRQLSYLNITRFMPTLLERKDRMSMACGLEVRVPYCDHELVEYAFNIPWAYKNYAGREKGILRAALKGLLPDSILWRKKSPYPKTHHPAYTKAVSQAVLQMLADPNAPIRPWLQVAKIRQLAQSADANVKLPWFGQLMSGPQFFAYLLQVNFWLKHYRIRIV